MIDLLPEELLQNTGRLYGARGTLLAKVKASVGELIEIRTRDGVKIPAEVIGFDQDLVQVMPFQQNDAIQKNDLVIAKNRAMTIPVGNALLGRVIDAVGNPIDNEGALMPDALVDLKFVTPNPLSRQDIKTPFVTGIRAIDGLNTIGKGQRVGLFAGSGVGKSTLLGDIARNAESDVNVVALIGERGREVRPFIEATLGKEGLSRSVVIVSTSDQSPLARVRASQSAIVVASWFRDQGKNVLLMLDSITRLANAQRELGLLLGEPPTSRGYTPSVFQQMAVLLEQLGNSDRGSITGILTVLVDGDDMNEPIADAARSILDGHIVLSRALAHKAHFPAIDVLASASRLFNEINDEQHKKHASIVRRMMANHGEVEDLIQIGAYRAGAVPATDAAVATMPAVNDYLQQPIGQPSSFGASKDGLRQLNQAYENSLVRSRG